MQNFGRMSNIIFSLRPDLTIALCFRTYCDSLFGFLIFAHPLNSHIFPYSLLSSILKSRLFARFRFRKSVGLRRNNKYAKCKCMNNTQSILSKSKGCSPRQMFISWSFRAALSPIIKGYKNGTTRANPQMLAWPDSRILHVLAGWSPFVSRSYYVTIWLGVGLGKQGVNIRDGWLCRP